MRTQLRNMAMVWLLLAALSAQVSAQSPEAPKPAAPTPPPSASPAMREVTDETGRRVRLPVEIRRIVSLAPNITETIYALGAADRLVGVTDFCDFPAEAAAKPKVGGPMNPNLEQIVAFKPDLILAQANGGNRRETVEAIERLGLPIYAANARNVEQILDSTRAIANLIGADEQGAKVTADLRARLDTLKRKLAGRTPRRAFFVVWHEPLITIGKNTFIADALRWAGADMAIELDQDWPRISLEEVARQQPEVLVFAGSHSEEVRRSIDDLRQRAGWRLMDAVRNNRVAIISDAVNRPAPRLIEAVEQLARQLHPAAFEEKPENGKEKMEKGGNASAAAPFPFSLFPFPNHSGRTLPPGGNR